MLEGTDVVQNDPRWLSRTSSSAAEKFKSQLEISPGAGDHYIGVNNKVGPFKNVDLRKALWAALDRTALDKVERRPAGHDRGDALHLPDDQRL